MCSVVLGVDGGSRNLGIAVLDVLENKLLYSEHLEYTHPKIQDRLPLLRAKLMSLCQEYVVTHIGIEVPYLKGANAMGVNYCSGVVYLVAGEVGIPIQPLSASEVKKLAGSGRASKLTVAEKAASLLNVPFEGLQGLADHVTDAILIAYTYKHKFLLS